ncbi:hypothetical protein ACLEUY_23175 [Enterobacter ludwigii]|uniref:hypothetical protein n=1 Tax=Enterobacter ludwigii TaxID=299767 RepID=UPI003976E130
MAKPPSINPVILITASTMLLEQQQLRKQKIFALSVMENQEAPLRNPDTPALGPGMTKVAVIEFYDYQRVVMQPFRARAGKGHESAAGRPLPL